MTEIKHDNGEVHLIKLYQQVKRMSGAISNTNDMEIVHNELASGTDDHVWMRPSNSVPVIVELINRTYTSPFTNFSLQIHILKS